MWILVPNIKQNDILLLAVVFKGTSSGIRDGKGNDK